MDVLWANIQLDLYDLVHLTMLSWQIPDLKMDDDDDDHDGDSGACEAATVE